MKKPRNIIIIYLNTYNKCLKTTKVDGITVKKCRVYKQII